MKKSNILMTGAAALVALVAVTGVAFMSFAHDDTSDTTADKPLCEFRMHKWQNLSEEEKAELEAQMEAKRAEMEAKQEAVQAALEAGDYQAWVQAVGEDSPMLEKINESNFSRYVEANNYMEQARGIFEELGITKGGFGKFGGHMGMRGFGGKLGGFDNMQTQ
jgi:hypothetical protein